MNRRSKALIGLGIILLALYFGYSAVIDSLTYYRGVDAVAKDMDYYSMHRVKMIGDIVNNTMKATDSGYMFDMESNGTVLGVKYNGTLPQAFTKDGRVVVIGKVENGAFQASEMNVKCPTKYTPT
ncbi:Cytochrome c-type biogenesis protein CcmE [uncultured archaeon]|nr:Cytochrome c-type biogenesis protein CcmE [uncultured archaeon]